MKKLIVLCALLISSYCILLAQPNMTLYQMHDISQSNSLNPAVPISCGWVVSFPGLGGISLGASSPISYNDFGAGSDTLHTSKVLSRLHNTNIFSSSGSINLLTIGYRAQHSYYQFSVNERYNVSSGLPQDPIKMLLRGNAQFAGQTIYSEPSVNALYYREYAFNYARELNSTMWVGARAKLLFGRLSLHSVNNIANFYTSSGTYDLQLKTDALLRASIPGKVTINPVSNKVSDLDVDMKAGDFIFDPSNIGAGIDLGITNTLNNGLQLSASVLNLGFVNWSKNVHTFRQNGTLNFTGPYSSTNELDALVDTVRSFLHLDYAQESYMQMLAPMVMAGGNYPVADYLKVGLTGMVEIQPYAFPWAITATAFTKGLPIVDLGLSYTITPYSSFNVGFGVGAHLGPVDIHFLADNIFGLMKPFEARYATIQMGISFRFGCASKEEADEKAARGGVPCPAFKSNGKLKYGAVPCSGASK